MDRDQARQEINSHPLTNYIQLERSRNGMYVCPVCGSGTHRNKSGALKLYPGNRVCCYSAGCALGDKGQDTLGALRIIWGCSENEVFQKVGIQLDGNHDETAYKAVRRPIPQATADYTEFYAKAHKSLVESDEALSYLHGRGISDESINRFNLGYVAAWSHPKDGRHHTKRIIIPRSAGTYTARAIDPSESDYSSAYKKQIAGTQRDIFNAEAMSGATSLVVVEGELDAISIMQATGADAVALGSVSNVRSFIERAARTAPEAVYIVALDNDPDQSSQAGQRAQHGLMEGLAEAGIQCIEIPGSDLYGACKDANELLVKDRDRLVRIIGQYVDQAEELKFSADCERDEERASRTGGGMLIQFMNQIETRDYEPMPTGLRDIDKALSGGFMRKTLVMLGAAPGTGKTMISQQILETMAAAGRHVLYINLEMSRDQLLARSISRICNRNGFNISALEVLRGYQWTDEQRDRVYDAAAEYLDKIADRFVYNPDGTTARLSSILSAMETEAVRLEAMGEAAPVVAVDYLQLVQGDDREDEVSVMKRAIMAFKEFAIRHDTVVYLIIATNRESNKSGQVNQWSGRDTSAIEYSGDMMLGLSYTAIENGEKVEIDGEEETATLQVIERLKREAYREGKALPEVCRRLSLKVLKNRFGDAGRTAELMFDGEHSTFTQIDRIHR